MGMSDDLGVWASDAVACGAAGLPERESIRATKYRQ